MSEGRAPTPDFDSSRYERPNKNWVCGHARDGCPCRIGPSPSGECRASAECRPRLVVRPGEEKGTWACTRPQEWGGACAAGPLPDGSCCRPIERCRPVRSLRAKRRQLTFAVVAASVGALLIGMSRSARDAFANPKPLSRVHSGSDFEKLAATHGGGRGCILCHSAANTGLRDMGLSALGASHASLSFALLSSRHPRDLSRIDRACVSCHEAQSFHQADASGALSCTACHREHQGAGAMAAMPAGSCVACHGSPQEMRASGERARMISPALFVRPQAPGLRVRAGLRPAEGFTEVITDFALDHPEFRALADGRPDANTLRFNHRLHLTGAGIPSVNGRPLDCAYCHQPDTSGAYMARVSFERSCRACHGLEFDDGNPGMQLPHGNPDFVRAYLRSLPVQYADYAVRRLGMSARGDIEAFVAKQLSALRTRVRSGADLERAVFLGDETPRKGAARAAFAGCALCHDVAWRGDAAPTVTPPAAPDRWMPGAFFSHAAHKDVNCAECHAAASSGRTSDVILPTQHSCVRCHSPAGGAVDACTGCHTYHNPPPAGGAPLASLP